MAKETISFNELRRIKDSLPDGSIPGPEGGIVVIDDNTILNQARAIIGEEPVL